MLFGKRWIAVILEPNRALRGVRLYFGRMRWPVPAARDHGRFLFRQEYNERRPHSGIGWQTPARFSAGAANEPVPCSSRLQLGGFPPADEAGTGSFATALCKAEPERITVKLS